MSALTKAQRAEVESIVLEMTSPDAKARREREAFAAKLAERKALAADVLALDEKARAARFKKMTDPEVRELASSTPGVPERVEIARGLDRGQLDRWLAAVGAHRPMVELALADLVRYVRVEPVRGAQIATRVKYDRDKNPIGGGFRLSLASSPHIEALDAWQARLETDPQLSAAIEAGRFKVAELEADECRKLMAAERR